MEVEMSVGATPESQLPYDRFAAESAYQGDLDRGYGWVLFAGTLLLMLGTLNFIEGIAAVSNSHFFAGNVHYIAGSLNTWGWVVLCIGVAEWIVGTGCSSRASSRGGSAWSSSGSIRSCS